MLFKTYNLFLKCVRNCCTETKLSGIPLRYNVPEHYQNAFHLANAMWVDNANWFFHRGMEYVYSQLVENLKQIDCSLSEDACCMRLKALIRKMEPCTHVLDVVVPFRRDSGCWSALKGHVAVHGGNQLPCLGGMRLYPSLERDHVKALATLSTYKYSFLGIPCNGAHCGLNICTSEFSLPELECIVRSFVQELSKRGFGGAPSLIIEPDMNCSPTEMSWMHDTLLKSGISMPCIVGKPVSWGGINGYEKAAAQGIFFAVDNFLNDEKFLERMCMEPGFSEKTYILQGLGKVGLHIAGYFHHVGAKCIGIQDEDFCIHCLSGIDVEAVMTHKVKYGTLEKLPDAKPYEGDLLLCEKCDILIIATTHNSITYYAAPKVSSRIVVEAAYGAISPSAHKILTGRGVLVLPDLYVLGGASLASYFEYVKSVQHMSLGAISMRHTTNALSSLISSFDKSIKVVPNPTLEKVLKCPSESDILVSVIDNTMETKAKEIMSLAEEFNLSLDVRSAAYIVAICNLFKMQLDAKQY